jgi:hypothetical protein
MPEYATLAEVKQRMPELGAGDDALITSLIFGVSAYFDRFTGQSFGSTTEVRTFSGNGSNQIFIRPPLTAAPTLVRVRSSTSEAWRTVPAGDIRLMPEGRTAGAPILWLEIGNTPTGADYLWPESDLTVEITGTWGRTGVPDDIREACLQTVVNLYRSRGSAGSDMEVGIGGTYMPDISKAMPLFAYNILRSYRRLVFA